MILVSLIDGIRGVRGRVAVAEWSLVSLGAIWFARFAYLHGGFVVGSDMLYYLDVGLRRVADPFIVNRYTHVYGLRLASILYGNTLGGVRLYSAAIAGLTVLLAYLSARFLTKEARLPNGLFATLLTLSIPLVATLVLAPSVDTTLMVIVLGFIALYLLRTSEVKPRQWLEIAMGVLFVLAIRTKEVGWSLAAIVPGFGFTADGSFQWSSLRNSLRHFIFGVAIGMSVMIIANTVFIGTPLFGLRPSDFASYFGSWSDLIHSKPNPAATISQLVIGGNGMVFVLFVAAGLWFGNSIPRATRILWLFPLILISFLLIGTTRTEWTIVPRGFLSGAAVMSLLASRVFVVHLPMDPKSIRMAILAFAIALPLAFYGYVTKADLPYTAYFELALAPALLGLVIALMIFSQNRDYSGWAVFGLLLALTTIAARANLSSVASELENSGWRARFSLPLALRDKLDPTGSFDAYFSWASLEGLTGVANREELSGLVNVALDGQTLPSDYQIGTVDESLIGSMVLSQHKYVIVTSSEWDWLRTAPQDRPEWRDKYEGVEVPGGRYVLLTLSD